MTDVPLDPQERFEQYFAGLWERRWWAFWTHPRAPRLVSVKSYRSGEITNGIVQVNAVADDGTRVAFEVDPTTKTLPGYKRIATPPTSKEERSDG